MNRAERASAAKKAPGKRRPRGAGRDRRIPEEPRSNPPVEKPDAIRILEEIAQLLELKGENPYKARAYANAARALEGAPESLADLVRTGRLAELPGIGEALEEKISTLARTGRLPYHEDLRAGFPPGIFEVLRIPGLGPRKARVIWEQLGVGSLGELEYACHENRLADLPGFGARSQERILRGIELLKRHRDRFHCDLALQEAEAILTALSAHPAVRRISLAGSVRRRAETSKDVDLVASSEDPGPLMEAFTKLPRVAEVVARGETKSSVRLASGMNADLRVVRDDAYPFALHYFTGSKAHNVAVRGRAQRMGLKLNEYGLFRGEERVPCRDEAEIYAELGLSYIPPEIREDLGEIDAAERGAIPELVTWEDLKGVLHVHTSASDGSASLEEMTRAARGLGLSYIGICDHSKAARYAGGLDERRVEEQHREIDAINRKLRDIVILKGIEVDILADGSLDFGDDVLATFDFVVASVHSRFDLDEMAMTGRIVRAIRNPRVHILGHPTGRLLLAREPYRVRMEEVIGAAADSGVALELNANPHRLDVDWRLLPRIREAGVRVAINPDAHHPAGIGDMRYGVGIARKGWLGAADVLNTLPAGALLRSLRAKGR
jgi:DNA polymerase (family 10)